MGRTILQDFILLSVGTVVIILVFFLCAALDARIVNGFWALPVKLVFFRNAIETVLVFLVYAFIEDKIRVKREQKSKDKK